MSFFRKLKQLFTESHVLETSEPAALPEPQGGPQPQQGALPSIGSAWMKKDGTIVLWLRAEMGSIVGDAQLDYPPNHPQYAEILEHLGGLVPGEQKSVKPWPETW